jgi:hypothetical protein
MGVYEDAWTASEFVQIEADYQDAVLFDAEKE